MLVFAAVRRTARWVATRRARTDDVVVIIHDHDHGHDELHHHAHSHQLHRVRVRAGSRRARGERIATTARHHHLHHHIGTLPDDPFPTYGSRTAFAVGALHGIGAETPTQILLFLAAARAGGAGDRDHALALLRRRPARVQHRRRAHGHVRLSAARPDTFALYATVSVVTAAFSLVVGVLAPHWAHAALPALAG